jgi:hypothetical protein
MATKASRIALAGSNISSTGEVDADLLDNIDSAAFLSLDSNGRLGIGTSTLTAPLNIQADVDARTLRIIGRSDDYGEIDFFENDNSTILSRIQAHNSMFNLRAYNVPIQFQQSGDTKMTIAADGDVGIGVTPYSNSKLTIGGTDSQGYSSVLMFDNNSSSGAEFFMIATDTAWTAGADKFIMGHGAPSSSNVDMTIDSSGQVGIGTYNPVSTLQIMPPNEHQNSFRIYRGKNNGYELNYLNMSLYQGNTVFNTTSTDSSGKRYIWQINGAEAARIEQDGSLNLLKTRGTISGGTSDTGAVIKLHTEAQWESGYSNNAAASTNDYLGSIEFSTGDSSTGEGVRAAIRGTVDSYYNQNSIVFETADGNVAEAPQERMRVLHNGNVGIGVANPGAQLSVNGPAALANLGGGSTGSAALYVNTQSNHVGEMIQVLRNGAIKMYMANDGDLALGHSSPSDKLDVQGADNGITIRSVTANRPVLSLINGSSTMLKISANGTYAAIGDGSDANRYMSFKGGYVGIGRTDPAATLDVKNGTGVDTAADTMVRFDNPRGSDWNVVIKNNNGSYGLDIRETPASGFLIYGRVNGGNNTFIVNGNGNVKNANNSYGAISDLKLKENIIDATSQWEDIKALRIRKYSFKTDELDQPNQLGVIAQELETAGMGGLVNTVQDVDIDVVGKPLLDTYTKDVKYSVLYMKAVKALQEAMSRIETLEARLTAAGIE